MTRVLAFAFCDTVAARVLAHLDLPAKDRFQLESQSGVIRSFVASTDLYSYTHIIGLGMCHRGGGKVRIETVATSLFRGRDSQKEVIELPNFIQGNEFEYDSHIGSSYCNLVSYLIAKRIKSEGTEVMYSFLHVPKSYDERLGSILINQELSANNLGA